MRFANTLLFLLIILALTSPVSAVTLKKAWEPSNKTVLILNEANNNLLVKAQFLHTEQDLTTFTETINLTSYVNYTFQASDLGISWQRFKGNNDIYKIETYRYVRTPYKIPIYGVGWNNWTESIFNNVTNQNEAIYHNESIMVPNGSETAYKLNRVLFNPNGKYITAGSSYLIDVVAYRIADTGETSIQTGFNLGGFTEYNATWWNTTWQFRYNQGALNPGVYRLNITNNTATFGNTTHINISCYQPACIDLRFTKENTTALPFWRYQNTSTNGTGLYGVWYFNVTSAGTGFQIYSGATSVSDLSDGNATFALFDSFDVGFDATKWYPKAGTWTWENGYLKNICASANCLLLSKSFNFTNGTLEADINPDDSTSNFQGGINGRNPNATTGGYAYFLYNNLGVKQHLLQKLGIGTLASDTNTWTNNVWHNGTRMIFNETVISGDVAGTNPLSATDATYARGQVSLDSVWTASRGNFFDNMRFIDNQTRMPDWATWGAQEIGVIRITSWSNNHTNDEHLSFTLPSFPKAINFNITTDFAPTNYTWFVNGSNQNVNLDNFTYNFTHVDFYTISVQTYNLTGDSYAFVNWTISVVPPTIVAVVPVRGCGERIFVNNTDLGPVVGTGDRVSGTIYYANISAVYVYIKAHNPTPADMDIHLSINGTLIQEDDVRTGSSTENRSKWFKIPRYAYYSIEIYGSHHYEWREYLADLDLSGCNFPEETVASPGIVITSALLAALLAILFIKRRLKSRFG